MYLFVVFKNCRLVLAKRQPAINVGSKNAGKQAEQKIVFKAAC
jgi:hypothetical protein